VDTGSREENASKQKDPARALGLRGKMRYTDPRTIPVLRSKN
jgi:hypothetical protein